MDVPSVAKCAPGVQSVEPLGDDKYRGTVNIQIGPVKLSLAGDVSITTKDEAAKTATMRADAADRRAGGAVKAVMNMAVSASESGSELKIETDAQVMGRIGEFGQPLIKRK